MKNISELLPDEPLPEIREDEIHFNNTVREYVLFGVVLLLLNIMSHIVVLHYRKKEPPLFSRFSWVLRRFEQDEAIVDRVALMLCTFSLSISIGAVLLLPVSIISGEILSIYQDSYYVRWINLSLIQGLWDMIFLFSNLSLILGLPFAYLFTEAEGFPGSRKGLRARIIETVIVLSLLVFTLFGVSFVLSFLFGYFENSDLFQVIDIWGNFYLPFLYSIMSCFGVLLLLICTPVGLVHMFTSLGQVILKPPGFVWDIEEQYQAILLAEESQEYQLKCSYKYNNIGLFKPRKVHGKCVYNEATFQQQLMDRYLTTKKERQKLYRLKQVSVIRRTLGYPFAFLILMTFTGAAVVIVVVNTLLLVVGFKALPLVSTPALLEAQKGKRMVLLSILGPAGAGVEVLLLVYLVVASLHGCYSLPWLRNIKPMRKNTPMLHILVNCTVVLILSSAFPLFVTTIGITNFDLLGDYGEVGWLGNFWIVLCYNVAFASAVCWCLMKKITATLWQGICLRFQLVGRGIWNNLRNWPSMAIHRLFGSRNVKPD